MANTEKTEVEEWDQIIRPKSKLLDFKLYELWRYRDLIYLFVRRDFVAQYKQTILGPAWHLLQPLLTTTIFTIVFGSIAKIPTDGVPPFLFYFTGTVIWGYFANVITDTSVTFSKNAHIFSKVYFPRLSVPIASATSKLIAFTIQFIFLLFFLYFFSGGDAKISQNAWVFATPLLLLLMALFALACGLLVSALTTRYQDLAVLVSFGVQLGMYASPVIYPISSLPEKWQFWANLNPVAPIIECFRFAFLGVGQFEMTQLIYSAIVISLLLALSLLVFGRVERTFADTI